MLTNHIRDVLQRAANRDVARSDPIDRLVFDTADGLWKVRIRMTESQNIAVTRQYVLLVQDGRVFFSNRVDDKSDELYWLPSIQIILALNLHGSIHEDLKVD